MSLRLDAGTTTYLTGPSGVGKTTIADLIVGLLRPQHGDVFVDGVALADIDMKTWRAQIGYVPQDSPLLHDTVWNNIALSRSPSHDEIRYALEISQAWSFVRALPDGMETIIGERGLRLSSGQRQRIALARALIHHPRLLILDEATNALDDEIESHVLSAIREDNDSVTQLVVSHRPNPSRSTDQVIRLGAQGVARTQER